MKRIAAIVLVVILACAAFGLILSLDAMPVRAAVSDGLVSCWDLDEASGIRYDAYGSNDLTDNNTVGQVAGVVDYAAVFDSLNTESLSVSRDDFELSEKSVMAWVYNPDARTCTGCGAYGVTSYDKVSGYGTDHVYSERVVFLYGSDYVYSQANFSEDSWNFVLSKYDETNMYIDVNRSVVTGTHSGPGNSDIDMAVGCTGPGMTCSDYRIDIVAVWNRVLSSAEADWLYNSGSGRSCTEIINSGSPTPTPTATTVPGGEYVGSLASGDWYTIDHYASYGDIFTLGGLAIIIIILILGFGVLIIKGFIHA